MMPLGPQAYRMKIVGVVFIRKGGEEPPTHRSAGTASAQVSTAVLIASS